MAALSSRTNLMHIVMLTDVLMFNLERMIMRQQMLLGQEGYKYRMADDNIVMLK